MMTKKNTLCRGTLLVLDNRDVYAVRRYFCSRDGFAVYLCEDVSDSDAPLKELAVCDNGLVKVLHRRLRDELLFTRRVRTVPTDASAELLKSFKKSELTVSLLRGLAFDSDGTCISRYRFFRDRTR